MGSINEVSFYGGMAVFQLRNAAWTSGQEVIWSAEGGPTPWIETEIKFSMSAGEGPLAGQTVLDFSIVD